MMSYAQLWAEVAKLANGSGFELDIEGSQPGKYNRNEPQEPPTFTWSVWVNAPHAHLSAKGSTPEACLANLKAKYGVPLTQPEVAQQLEAIGVVG